MSTFLFQEAVTGIVRTDCLTKSTAAHLRTVTDLQVGFSVYLISKLKAQTYSSLLRLATMYQTGKYRMK